MQVSITMDERQHARRGARAPNHRLRAAPSPLHQTICSFSDPTAEQYSLRRSRAGDAWDRAQAESCGVPTPGSGPAGNKTNLGMPSLMVRG